MPNFLKTHTYIDEILRFFDFPNGRHQHLGYLKSQNFIGCRVQSSDMHHRSKFHQNWSINCGDNAIIWFSFRSWHGGHRHLEFWIYKILLADGLWRAHKHHCAKRCQNWSFYCGDNVIFEFSRWLPPGSRRTSMPNIVEIGQLVA